MKRRDFLKWSTVGGLSGLSAGLGAIAWTPRAEAALVTKTFYVTQGTITQPDGVSVFFKGFSSASNTLRVPGESMIVQEGDTVRISVTNTLNTAHSFVINGLVDSGTIAGGQTKTIEFIANKVGSFLYYDKLNAPYNRLLGLHGGFAVMPSGSSTQLYAGSPTFKKQYFWIFNDIDPVWHERVRLGATPTTVFMPRYFTINGKNQRPPGAPGYSDPNINSGYDPQTMLEGAIGDRSLLRVLNAGGCTHSMHFHANHVEWLTANGAVRPDIWRKDVIPLDNNMGAVDLIFPFEQPPDAHPPVRTGHYVMHLHDEQTQTAGGGRYQFGAATTIKFK